MDSKRKYTVQNGIEESGFKKWMDEIERIVYSRLDLYLLDLPDEPYRVDFEDSVEAKDVAARIIRDYMNRIADLGIDMEDDDDSEFTSQHTSCSTQDTQY